MMLVLMDCEFTQTFDVAVRTSHLLFLVCLYSLILHGNDDICNIPSLIYWDVNHWPSLCYLYFGCLPLLCLQV